MLWSLYFNNGYSYYYYSGNDIGILSNNNEFQEGLQTGISNLNKLDDSFVSLLKKPLSELTFEDLQFWVTFDEESFLNLDFDRLDQNVLNNFLETIDDALVYKLTQNWEVYSDSPECFGAADILQNKDIVNWTGDDLAEVLMEDTSNLYEFDLSQISSTAWDRYFQIHNNQIHNFGSTTLPNLDQIHYVMKSNSQVVLEN